MGLLAITSFQALADAIELPIVGLTQPRLMRTLEERGLSFGKILSNGQLDTIVSNETLTNKTAFKGVAQELDKKLKEAREEDKTLGVGMQFPHRQFDMKFLSSQMSRFALVAIVNRMDRMYVDPESCGEIRLIYRLAYNLLSQGESVSSRLPMTINLVFRAKPLGSKESCSDIASRWKISQEDSQVLDLISDNANVQITSTVNSLLQEDSPIALNKFTLPNLVQLEINLQSTRWPSAVRPQFGGYGEYHLQVFKLDSDKNLFIPAKMENELDLQKIKTDPQLKNKLKSWIKNLQNLKSIDDGIAVIPEEFLATSGKSVTPGGSLRLQNRPVIKLFKEADFSDIDFSSLKRIKDPSALLRKIDEQSCIGCHQVRNVAGFHLMGKDPNLRYIGNSVFLAGSPHFYGDQPRRVSFVKQLSEKKAPSFERGFVSRPDDNETLDGTGLLNGWGALCSLGKNASYKKWTCAQGFVCSIQDVSDVDSELGVCLPPQTQPQIGDPCEKGVIKINTNPHKDQRILVSINTKENNGEFNCSSQNGGFPGGGMLNLPDCSKSVPNSSCGTLPRPGFNTCLTQNNFVDCLKEFSAPRSMRSCDERNPCRDDYICSQSSDSKTGACVPPYFLFQFRVDGHPIQ